jgi:hypothetical protein
MDISSLKDFKINVWYRGFKLLSVIKINGNTIILSNADKISVGEDGKIHLNGKMICNMPDISCDDLLNIYKWHLKKKGYKFLEE